MPHLWLLSRRHHAVNQVLPKIYKETKYCLIYGCYQDITMQLPGVTKDI